MSSIYAAKKIKEERPDSKIIFGGPETFLTYRARLYLQLPFIDLIIYHPEGEIPLLKILTNIRENNSIYNSPGIGFLKNKKIKFTDPPELLNINKIPIPKYELLENLNISDLKALDILTAKGCLNKCVYCNENSIWGKFRKKEPQTVLKEINYYINNYGIYNFEIVDNAFNLSDGIRKAFKIIYDSKTKIKWGGNCELSHINEKRILEFNKIGLDRCYFGLESASPKVLNIMRKKINLSQFSKLLKILPSANIRALLYLMVGFPNETDDDFMETVDFIKKNSDYIDNIIISVFTLMNSSPIFNSDLLKPIALGPKGLNAWTYQTNDGITHKDRLKRFLLIKNLWKKI